MPIASSAPARELAALLHLMDWRFCRRDHLAGLALRMDWRTTKRAEFERWASKFIALFRAWPERFSMLGCPGEGKGVDSHQGAAVSGGASDLDA